MNSSYRSTLFALSACGLVGACGGGSSHLIDSTGPGIDSPSGQHDAPTEKAIDAPSDLPSGVFAIPLVSPADSTGFLYTPQVTVAGNTFLLDLDTGSTDVGIGGSSCNLANSGCMGLSPLYTPGSNAVQLLSGGSAVIDSSFYGDGSFWEGSDWTDDLLLVDIGTPLPDVSVTFADIFAASFMGSGSNDNFPFFQGDDYQGIFGVGRDDLLNSFGSDIGTTAYLDAVVKAGVTDILGVEMCGNDGTFWLGGVDPAHAGGSALQFTPLLGSASCGEKNQLCGDSVFYAVDLTAMHLGSGSAAINTGLTEALAQGPILDTGTSLFFIPSPTETNVVADLNKNANFKTLFPGQVLTDPTNAQTATDGCVAAGSGITSNDIDDQLPPLTMTFGTGSAAITLSAPALSSYLLDSGPLCELAGSGSDGCTSGSGGPEAYCMVMLGGGDAQPNCGPPGQPEVSCGGMIMGDMFLRGFVTEIDLVNETAGFAPTTFCPAPDVVRATAQHPATKPREHGRGPDRMREEERRVWQRRMQQSTTH